MKDEKECRQYFLTKPWQRQLEILLKKYQGYGAVRGTMSLKNATAEECKAAGLFLGRRFTPPIISYTLAQFEERLQRTKFEPESLQEFLACVYQQPICSKAEKQSAATSARNAFFARAVQQAECEAAKHWLMAMQTDKTYGYRLLVPIWNASPAQGNAVLMAVLRGAALLEEMVAPERLAVFAAKATGDPHSFDANQPAGKLLLYLLCYMDGCAVPQNAEQRTELLFVHRLICDDISSSVIQRGLILFCGGKEHPAWRAMRERGEFCVMALSNLNGLDAAQSPTGRVYVVENQMVFSHLCENVQTDIPMICTAGRLKVAAWRLLDLLASSGCEMYYSGDFDPEGMDIAQGISQRYPARFHFWRYTPEDYRRALSEERIKDTSMKELERICAEPLRATAAMMREVKRAGYQEQILEQLQEDIAAHPAKLR